MYTNSNFGEINSQGGKIHIGDVSYYSPDLKYIFDRINELK